MRNTLDDENISFQRIPRRSALSVIGAVFAGAGVTIGFPRAAEACTDSDTGAQYDPVNRGRRCGPTIGAPDGTRYTVVTSETVVYPSVTQCGTYGELPTGVPAEFRRELREFTTYTDCSGFYANAQNTQFMKEDAHEIKIGDCVREPVCRTRLVSRIGATGGAVGVPW